MMQQQQILDRATAFFQRMRVVEQYRQSIQATLERKLAVRFNLLEQFIEPDEKVLSQMLAWILDPSASHGQGDVFLRLFLKGSCKAEGLNLDGVHVATEVCTTHIQNSARRIDIVVTGSDWILGIENKPWAMEQSNQLSDYQEHLGKQNKAKAWLVFLAGNVGYPVSFNKDYAKCPCLEMSYNSLSGWDCITWLEQCMGSCEAERVRFFLLEFKEYIQGQFVGRTMLGQEVC